MPQKHEYTKEKRFWKRMTQFGFKKSSRQTEYNYLYHADTVGATDETSL